MRWAGDGSTEPKLVGRKLKWSGVGSTELKLVGVLGSAVLNILSLVGGQLRWAGVGSTEHIKLGRWAVLNISSLLVGS